MTAPYDEIAFWQSREGEDPNDWRNRLLDDGVLVGASDLSNMSYPGLDALHRFLGDAEPRVRAAALQALACVGVDWPHDELEARVLERLEDPSPEVRVEAVRCCRANRVADSVPILLGLLAKDSLVRAALADAARPPLAREVVGAFEAMDVQEARGPLAALGVHSNYLDRAEQRVAKERRIGRYVPSPAGHTPVLPAQELSANPACPGCGEPSWILATLREPHGPRGAGDVPFYRCLSCVTHTPLFVELLPTPRSIGTPGFDLESGSRAPDPGVSAWSVEWQPGEPTEHPWVLVLGGGLPVWVQSDETPVCPRCDRRMVFAVQLPGDSEHFPVVEFQGVVYGFWCGSCRVSATLFQE